MFYDIFAILLATFLVFSLFLQALCNVPFNLYKDSKGCDGSLYVSKNPLMLSHSIVCFFNLCGLSIAGVWKSVVMMSGQEFVCDGEFNKAMCCFIIAYMIFATLGEFFEERQHYEIYAHHYIVVVLAVACLQNEAFRVYVPFVFGVVEISSVFLSACIIMKKGTYFASKFPLLVNTILPGLFVLSFFVTRIVLLPMVISHALNTMYNIILGTDDLFRQTQICLVILFTCVIQVMQFYWFGKMLVKKFGKKKVN